MVNSLSVLVLYTLTVGFEKNYAENMFAAFSPNALIYCYAEMFCHFIYHVILEKHWLEVIHLHNWKKNFLEQLQHASYCKFTKYSLIISSASQINMRV